MHLFMEDDFLLKNKISKKMFHEWAENMPIFDFHNHLSAKEIYEDKRFSTLAEVWLAHDHYKWRAMRTWGIPEQKITGEVGTKEQFLAWAETIQNSIGNPLYHWTHLELQRYFQITEPLTVENAQKIWDICNEKLAGSDFSVRNLLWKQRVEALCTTDDPLDDLFYHKRLKEEGFSIGVFPTFRPDRAIQIEKEDFLEYIAELSKKTGKTIQSLEELLDSLEQRLLFFQEAGCFLSDHSVEASFYGETTKEEGNIILQKRLNQQKLSEKESAQYRGCLLKELGKLYARQGMAMQLHIGAKRNNSTRKWRELGNDSGLDSMNDRSYAEELGKLLDAMDQEKQLPKTILYCLNPNDMSMAATMIGNFQGDGIHGKMQLGAAWWFNDHKRGIQDHFALLAAQGLVSTFIGMVTDSRSFLSFPRHEYFRRIICNQIGEWVEDGEYPYDEKQLRHMVEGICFYNAKQYFTDK